MVEKKFRQYANLDDALEQKRIPLANRPIIRGFVAAIGCSRFEETSGYIKAIRVKHGMPLWIGSGWAEGFETQEEAEAAHGIEVWHGRHGWGIWLPINSAHVGGGTHRPTVTSGKFCLTCYEELSLTRECPNGHPQPQESDPVSLPRHPTGS